MNKIKKKQKTEIQKRTNLKSNKKKFTWTDKLK